MKTNFTICLILVTALLLPFSFGCKKHSQEDYSALKGLKSDMVPVKGGTFEMGDNLGDINARPIHTVTVGDFKICKTEVTQALWVAVMGNNPSNHLGDNLPVEEVSWDDVQNFLEKLNKITGLIYRLPTEAEWEYAAGGGATNRTKYAGTDNYSEINKYAWYNYSVELTQPVGLKQPNRLGLYDMNGNVWEWVNDSYALYSSEAQINPKGPSSGQFRVFKGGCYLSNEWFRVTYREYYYPYIRNNIMGFRLSCD